MNTQHKYMPITPSTVSWSLIASMMAKSVCSLGVFGNRFNSVHSRATWRQTDKHTYGTYILVQYGLCFNFRSYSTRLELVIVLQIFEVTFLK